MSEPVVQVSAKGARYLRRGSPWCYRDDVLDSPRGLAPGALVQVVDAQRNPLGQALWASRSPIALRLLSRGREARVLDEAFFRAALAAAIARRAPLSGRDALRLVHGESDLLPGLFVDRYADALVVQTLCEGMDARKALFARHLAELTQARLVVCRDDGSGRDFEKLPREAKVLEGGGPTTVTFHEGLAAFEVDLLTDMKTGSFLDQVDNHLRAGELARGEALDCFSYHGGFALSLARSCSKVTAVEQDERAAARIEANASRSGLANVQVVHGNAFDLLRALGSDGRRFDTVVLDPPGFAKRKEGLPAALRAYHDLNVRALKLLAPEGLLVTCSCSGKLTRADFEAMVLEAAHDAKRPVQILERRGAGLDHPVLAGLPESEYLKVYFLRGL